MAMSPVGLSLLGLEPVSRTRRGNANPTDDEVPPEVQQVPELRPVRPSRSKPSSYYNSFQTVCSVAKDSPPSYECAVRQPSPRRYRKSGNEPLPGYCCTVEKTAKVLLQLEAISPLHEPTDSEWREVFMILRGTLLSFHRVKDNGPGKLLRSYTLQHAEIGLATDSQHTVLVPQTRLARLIPHAARRKAWQNDPHLFSPVRQHLMRLRVETDQIVIANAEEDQIHSWLHAIGAGIDIAHAIDERSIPRQCTVPRRRRRQQANQTGDISDPQLVAEQERILRDMYPAFAEQTSNSRPGVERSITAATDITTAETMHSTARDEDEVDIAAFREDSGALDETTRRPPMTRNTTASSVLSAYSVDMMYATSPSNFGGEDGKWQPPHTRTAQQAQRYIRRCMPVLNANASRASDIIICQGKRLKINWRMEMLEEWQLQPPSYRSHHFDDGLDLELTRTQSQHSAAESARQESHPQISTSDLGSHGEDQISRVEDGLANLDMAKTAVVTMTEKGNTAAPKSQNANRHPGRPGQDIHGVVFCF